MSLLSPCMQVKMRLQVTVTMLITFAMCNICKSEDEFKTGMEEGDVQLHFPYPCNSTKVTLQDGNRAPFYTLTESESISLSAARVDSFTFKHENKSDHCSLYLQINPLKRTDAGTLIFSAYGKDGNEKSFKRIGLHVDFLPGKASCTLNAEYIDEKWAELHCKATVGSTSGQIDCYQNGERMPPLTATNETTKEIEQTILVIKAQPVYCCAYAWEHPKDRCTCTDFHWDLANNKNSSGIIDPCHSTTSISSTEKETSDVGSSSLIPTAMEDKIIRINDQNDPNDPWLSLNVTLGLAAIELIFGFVSLLILQLRSRNS